MNTEINIRRATIDDATGIAAAGRQSFGDAFREIFLHANELEDYLNYQYNIGKIEASLRKENNIYFVAETGGGIVGFLKMKLHSPNVQLASESPTELQKIYVVKEYHGKGPGRLLMQAAIDFCEELKTEYIWLNVHIQNTRALKVYKQCGFVIIGRHFYTIGTQNFEFHLMAKPIAITETLNK